MGLTKWVARGRAVATNLARVRRGRPHRLPGQLVLSLTSYPPRFPTLHLTLKRLLSQTVKPDATVLWVDEAARIQLPAKVSALQRDGLTIRTCRDMGPFTKIVPSLQAYPEAFIATADDDTCYPLDWLQGFMAGYRGDNTEILCRRGRRVGISPDGRIQPYREWTPITQEHKGSDLMPLGVGGVLYPPGALPAQTTNDGEFRRLCPHADDIWLYWMAAQAGRSFRLVKPIGRQMAWPDTQLVGLYRSNQNQGGNDRQIAALVQAYGLP